MEENQIDKKIHNLKSLFHKNLVSKKNQLQVLLNIRTITYNQILSGLRDNDIPKIEKFKASVILFKAFIPRHLQTQSEVNVKICAPINLNPNDSISTHNDLVLSLSKNDLESK